MVNFSRERAAKAAAIVRNYPERLATAFETSLWSISVAPLLAVLMTYNFYSLQVSIFKQLAPILSLRTLWCISFFCSVRRN